MSKTENICNAIRTLLDSITVSLLPYWNKPTERFSPVSQIVEMAERPAAFVIRGQVTRDTSAESDISEIYTMDIGILVLVQPLANTDTALTDAENVVRNALNNEKLGGLALYVEHRRTTPFTAENVLPMGSTLLDFEVGFVEDRTVPTVTQ
jgi:hypothetical protein